MASWLSAFEPLEDDIGGLQRAHLPRSPPLIVLPGLLFLALQMLLQLRLQLTPRFLLPLLLLMLLLMRVLLKLLLQHRCFGCCRQCNCC